MSRTCPPPLLYVAASRSLLLRGQPGEAPSPREYRAATGSPCPLLSPPPSVPNRSVAPADPSRGPSHCPLRWQSRRFRTLAPTAGLPPPLPPNGQGGSSTASRVAPRGWCFAPPNATTAGDVVTVRTGDAPPRLVLRAALSSSPTPSANTAGWCCNGPLWGCCNAHCFDGPLWVSTLSFGVWGTSASGVAGRLHSSQRSTRPCTCSFR